MNIGILSVIPIVSLTLLTNVLTLGIDSEILIVSGILLTLPNTVKICSTILSTSANTFRIGAGAWNNGYWNIPVNTALIPNAFDL